MFGFKRWMACELASCSFSESVFGKGYCVTACVEARLCDAMKNYSLVRPCFIDVVEFLRVARPKSACDYTVFISLFEALALLSGY